MTTYTLFGQSPTPTLATDNTAYTMGVQFSVSQAGCTLTGVWWYSPSGADALPQTIALYTVSGGTLVHSESASWSGLKGTGWVRAGFSSPPSLTQSTAYVAAIFNADTNSWYALTGAYWSSGAGSAGITNGPLSAPNNAGSANGQDVFNVGGTLAFPSTTFNAANYWVDPEVSLGGGTPHTATGSLTVTPSFTAARKRAHFRTASLTVTPALTATVPTRHSRSASLTVTPGSTATPATTVPPGPVFTRAAVPGFMVPGDAEPGLPARPLAGPSAVFTAGTPYFRWAAGTPYFRWAAGDPYLS